jgi:MFS family permease
VSYLITAAEALPETTSPPRKARIAVLTAFAINGVAGANWFVRIPAVQDDLGLSTAGLGVVLLSLPLGALLAMILSGRLISRAGSRRVVQIGTLGLCLSVALLGLAPNAFALTAVLLLFGLANGAQDVAMNAQGVAVERRYGRSLMSSFHAGWSIGSMAGAAIGGVIAAIGVAPGPHLLVVGLVLAVAGLGTMRWLLPAHIDVGVRQARTPLLPRVPRAVLLLGLVGFCGLLAEGAMADWSAVYLQDTVGTGAGLAAAGYAVFQVAMTAGRLGGDHLTDRLGAERIVRGGGLLAAGGLGLALLLVQPAGVLVGFVLAGLGLSLIAPIVYSTAGRAGGREPGPAIAATTTIGFTGFLVGPPLIGIVAGVLSLRGALGLVAGLLLVMALLAPVTRRAQPKT